MPIENGMAAEELPDLDALALEYIQLERRHADVQRRHERIVERLAAFPSPFAAHKERELSEELDAMVARMRRINALLLPIRRVG